MSKTKITIQDVADIAGVSITTVSRVINKNYPVKESTRLKVEKAIEELKFRPNMLARGLINNKTFTIGVIVPSIANLFFPGVIKGIENKAKEWGYTLFLSDSEGNPKEEKRLLAKLIDRQVDGIIMIDPRKQNIQDGYLEEVTKNIPLVVINGYSKGVRCHFVLNDQEMGTYGALQELIKEGHKKIAFLRGKDSYSYDIKEHIYYDLLQKEEILIRKDNILVIEDGNSTETADLSMEAVMKRMGEKSAPTAIFACNDNMAVGALNGVRKLGLRVPEDVSIIGYDNTMISQLTEPKLTTVDQNMFLLGQKAADRLQEVMSNKEESYTKIVLENKLIRRGTVGKAKDK